MRRDAFEDQARNCEALGSPFMGELMRMLPDALEGTAIGERIAAWPGEIGPLGHSVPLRLAGALHALVLSGDPLAAAYPGGTAAALAPALRDALARRAGDIDAALDSPPQTNEIRRSAALVPVATRLAARHRLPMDLLEVGASAGINTAFDRYAVEADGWRIGPEDAPVVLHPDWAGPPPPDARIEVASRAGCDLSPIDVADPTQRLRLLSYLWPDQPERRRMTEAAIAAGPVVPERMDALEFIAARLRPAEGRLTLLFHTIAWQYLPPGAQAQGEAMIEAAGARAGASAPLARLSVENDGAGRGAAIVLTTWPGGAEPLGRADFHGRWVEWTGGRQALAEGDPR